MRLIPLILVTMKRFLFLVLASSVVFVAQAQRVYFMYLQSENTTPFFVKMADKVYSSSATGYVILSNLKDSTYAFSIGFPGGKVAETRFSVTINQGDRGFLLKNFQEGLALFDLQSLDVIKSLAIGGIPENVQVVARNDAFTRSLSEAADDESLLYTTVAIKKEEPKKEEKKEVAVEPRPDVAVEKKLEPKSDVVAVVDSGATRVETAKATELPRKEEPKADTLVAAAPAKTVDVKKEESKEEPAKADVAKAEEGKKDTVASPVQQPVEPVAQAAAPKSDSPKAEPAAAYKRSVISKRSESSTTEGFGLVYIDHRDEGVDTIRLLIPNPKKPFVEEATAKEDPAQKLEESATKELQAKTESPKPEEKQKEDGATSRTDKEDNTKRGDKKTFKDFTSDIFKAPQASAPEAKAERRKVKEKKAEEAPVTTDADKAAAGTKKGEKKTLKDFTSDIFKAPQPQEAAPEVKVENSACTALATDKDFLKVRKNMAAETNDERMIEEAKVFFRSKCFTTQQIRNLSGLFLTSAAKYQFYDAAYKHVTDPSAFPTLESEIKDPYYLKRFKALIGE